MALAQQYSNISEEVMEYLFDQKIRERDLIAEKEELKLRMNKIEEHLVLLQNRDDELTCMIATDMHFGRSSCVLQVLEIR
ncbi:uncharacterized protein LOC111604407 isoform X2 [Drosophila hydei]|uniref:Uncharacterized protein LOC111604407 isoform X2 n=1 Tax=Drosophila hydei TaxID=7224 RepID=A0A6J1MMJ8_DROHY|nr:uncharacterized protein LOC111604407 isoform X2 [Drosophila hydei]